MKIEDIQKSIHKEWTWYESILGEALSSSSDHLDFINAYILGARGKQIRPVLSILISKALGKVSKRTITCAVVAEMIHTATLLHDDVTDNSAYRRGQETVQSLFNPTTSVLTGDYWLAKALTLMLDERDIDAMRYFTIAVKDLVEGELLQLHKSLLLDTTEEDYYSIVSKKTSSLFTATVKSTLSIMDVDPVTFEGLGNFAYNLGIAFQIKDDIFDYMPELDTGKPTGQDIIEKKLTLPLIASLKMASKEERDLLISALRDKKNSDAHILDIAYDLVVKYRGNDVAHDALSNHCNKALAYLEVLPESIYKSHLISLTRHMVSRDK